MNYLQIQYGNLSNKRKIMIYTVLDKLSEGDTYTMIAEKKYINDDRISYLSVENTIQEIMDEGEPYRKYWNIIKNESLPFLASDLIRFWYLSKVPFTLYLDTDIELLKTMEKPQEPIICKLDYFLIYNHDRTDIFKTFLDKYVKHTTDFFNVNNFYKYMTVENYHELRSISTFDDSFYTHHKGIDA